MIMIQMMLGNEEKIFIKVFNTEHLASSLINTQDM